MIMAALPARIDGHFGPHLRRFGSRSYREAQTAMLRLVALLHSLGILIGEHFMYSRPASKARW
jgi:hypothetical protein